MTKAELVANLAEETNVTKAAVERVVDALSETIKKEVATTGRFALTGVGVFKLKQRAACQRNHPQNPGQKVQVPAHQAVTFKAAQALKEMVN
jgi:DNA-binding protein HU-beta